MQPPPRPLAPPLTQVPTATHAPAPRPPNRSARPAPNGVGCEQILPVNYEDITRGASTATNYQLLPGDRLFIAEDPLTRVNAALSKITQPFERVFGFVSLGTATASRIVRFGLGLNN